MGKLLFRLTIGPLNAVKILKVFLYHYRYDISHVEVVTTFDFKIFASNIRVCHKFSITFPHFVIFCRIAPPRSDLEKR